ncbi:uncharacterized protein DS421_3g87210 [Arachis hypogaea]|nr:uncharacterized protein DS421_3g87210 [Arachis hypogaea]
MHGAQAWCGLGASWCCVVRVWCESGASGASWCDQMLPCPRQGQGRKVDAPDLRSCVRWCCQEEIWCARKQSWCARMRVGAWDDALPAPRAGQESFGAPGEERARQMLPGREFGAPGSKVGAPEFCVWCASPIAALPAPRAGQGPFLHDPCSKLGGGKHATFLSWLFGTAITLSPWLPHVPDSALHKGRAEFASLGSKAPFCALPLEWAGQSCLPWLGHLMLPS